MSLASHHIYGSSRLGISSYWPLQYGNNWDYGNGVYDTLRLNQALPWYSTQYSDVIATGKTSPYGNGLMNTIVAQNLLGQKQYELTNHLGNVQATISDKRFPKDLNSDGQVDAFRAEVRAAYDYYPYGMLMPDRYVQDTARHCMLVSQTTMVTSTVSTITPWWGHWPSVPTWPGTGFTFGQIDNGISFTISGLNAFTQIPVSVDPGSSVFSFDVPVMYYAPLRMALTETVDGTEVLLASGIMSKTGTYNFDVTAQTGNLTLSFYDDVPHVQPIDNSLPYLWFVSPRWRKTVTTPQTTIVQICNGGKDAYEFGFNGQMKTNEIAGVGNHNTAEFWEYDTRLGRRWNRDPKPTVGLSIYSVMGGNPILNRDLLGDVFESSRFKLDKNRQQKEIPYAKTGEQNLTASLSEKTGLKLSFNDKGIMEYEKDKDGNPIINGGSEDARNDLIKLIDDKDFTYTAYWFNGSSKVSGGKSTMREKDENGNYKGNRGFMQIDIADFRKQPKFYDMGMVTLHEMNHGYFGLSDSPRTPPNPDNGDFGDPGPTVKRVNVYEKQLNYPLRVSYESINGEINFLKTETKTGKNGEQKTINTTIKAPAFDEN